MANTGGCDPDRIKLVSNDVLDNRYATYGGVYLVTLRQIEAGWVRTQNHRGWAEPVCAGTLLPDGTRHPTS